jgi:ABC-2 type transport system permease protein
MQRPLLARARAGPLPYRPEILFGMIGIVFVTSFTMTAFGLVLAARVKSVQTLMPLVQMLLMPLMFLSGTLYPVGAGAPRWLALAVRYNPLSYAVTAARTVLFANLPDAQRHPAPARRAPMAGWMSS